MNIDLKKHINIFLALVYIVLTVFAYQNDAMAGSHKKKIHRVAHKPGQASLVVNAHTGAVLHQSNANRQLYPASLTKLMTIYLTFEAINQGKIHFDSRLKVSKFAATRPRTNLGLKVGGTITTKEAVLSLIVRSANDSAVVLAEAIAGSEDKFARLMNIRAKQLGMHASHFVNASGWHHPTQKTTAYDMAKLAIALKRDFPEKYALFSRTSFVYGSSFYKGHNRVVQKLRGAEGMKTGYTSPSGWNLVTTAKRGDTRLVGVVLGGVTAKHRDEKMIDLMNRHFKHIELAKNPDARVYAMAKPSTKQNNNIVRVSSNATTNEQYDEEEAA